MLTAYTFTLYVCKAFPDYSSLKTNKYARFRLSSLYSLKNFDGHTVLDGAYSAYEGPSDPRRSLMSDE
jgi:hypothetical protein